MKVFISWSGNTSLKVAQLLREWLPYVINSIEPYVSSDDIDKGARWSVDIAKELEDSTFGILCVTKDNLEAPCSGLYELPYRISDSWNSGIHRR